MRLVVAGTPEAAVPTLETLAASEHEIVAVISREDAPRGRKRVRTPSPVSALALDLELPLIRTNRLDDQVTAQLTELQPDLGVIVAYGGIVREPLLSTPRLGWINLHFSQLPKWRGAAPVQRAVLAGERESGIAVFQLEAGLDTGPTFVNRPEPIGADETAGELLTRLAQLGAQDVLATVNALSRGEAVATPQQGSPTHAAKLSVADGEIDWRLDAERVYATIRGATPEPGASTELDGARFKIHEARRAQTQATLQPAQVCLDADRVLVGTGSGALELVRVQPAGKAAMNAADWFRGRRTESVMLG